ncbi:MULTISPECIES: SGNH/GDSL hydrolase family protein [Paraburkholderia]|uniref:SGNH/GDSL hydrolase family protein n=1 Tax=Paraburkholderia TaxID=1822464 RepID=UPI0022517526|nr:MULTISPECIES: SGNH/GDSL hydrolase family protein [Paraburkholderia]MCX4163556.1 SGNH/GDSL hydrolase family protein [Paraburkholderia megapolitana]MDN7159051.1 SGNH/GDSL hydrolase family protein [Paraburkholderia sp. CHISQ3]MDQ6496098.1 SGNH/GDSL hydrolase family protein [Paraburkholderia megapolitana]
MNRNALAKRRRLFANVWRRVTGLSLIAAVAACGGVDSNTSQWVASWYAAQQNYNEVPPPIIDPSLPPLTISNQTVRQIVHTSYGGSQIRIKLSNLFGTTPVTFAAVHVARSTGNGNVDTTTDRTVTFSGQGSVTLTAGAEMWSDSVTISSPAQSDLAVSLFIQGNAPVVTAHVTGQQTNYLAPGNQSSAGSLSGATTNLAGVWPYYWLSEVDVSSADKVKVIVTFGDSITDGYQSTVDTNHRWPNFFDDRVQAAVGSVGRASVVNAGISGNRWLQDIIGPAGQGRFARDVTGVSGATHVVILLGINDIGFGMAVPAEAESSDQIIAAINAAIAQAKNRKMKVFLATLLPYQGADYFDAAGETKRQAINAYIRSASGVDGVIDFDKAMQDPSNPATLLPAYDSGDHLHPNDAGYQAMANAIDLNLLNR